MSCYETNSYVEDISLEMNRNINEVAHIFSENITRVWYFMRNISFIPIVNPSFLSQISIIRGKDTWTEGNEFKGYWVGVCSFKGKCKKVIIEPHHKEIVIEYFLSIDVVLTTHVKLHKITEDDTTLVLLAFQMVSIDDLDYIPIAASNEGYRPFFKKLLEDFDNFIKESPLAQINYESIVINKERRIVFNLITNLNNFANIAAIFCKNFEYKGNTIKEGTFVKAISRFTNQTIYFIIKKVVNDESLNNWIFILETFGIKVGILKQRVEFNVLKINQNETLLSLTHSFTELLTKEEYDNFIKIKREAMSKLRTYFETN